MKKSQNILNRIIGVISLATFALFAHPSLLLARPRPCVYVELDSRTHVTVQFRLKLTYHIPPTPKDQPLIISITPNAVCQGAGLVFEHIAPDGTRTTHTWEPEPWCFARAETLEIESSTVDMYFHLWVAPNAHLELPGLGIYHITYVHPWEDPNSLVFTSNTLTVACVTPERHDQLHKILWEDPKLALASYRFKNPPLGEQEPKYRRAKYLWTIDEAISIGSEQDEVLLLLGSPDTVGYATPGLQEIHGYDEEWFYETSPVGGYYVQFKNGCVVRKGKHADSPG